MATSGTGFNCAARPAIASAMPRSGHEVSSSTTPSRQGRPAGRQAGRQAGRHLRRSRRGAVDIPQQRFQIRAGIRHGVARRCSRSRVGKASPASTWSATSGSGWKMGSGWAASVVDSRAFQERPGQQFQHQLARAGADQVRDFADRSTRDAVRRQRAVGGFGDLAGGVGQRAVQVAAEQLGLQGGLRCWTAGGAGPRRRWPAPDRPARRWSDRSAGRPAARARIRQSCPRPARPRSRTGSTSA